VATRKKETLKRLFFSYLFFASAFFYLYFTNKKRGSVFLEPLLKAKTHFFPANLAGYYSLHPFVSLFKLAGVVCLASAASPSITNGEIPVNQL